MDALSFGLGVIVTVLLLAPFLWRGYCAHAAQRDYQLAQRVNGMVRDILASREAADPDSRKLKAGRPSNKDDAFDAAYHKWRTMQDSLDEFAGMLEYLKLGGHPDDKPAQVMRNIEKGKGNK